MSRVSLILFLGLLFPASLPAAQPVNILFILIDDLGWTDLGCYGNDFIQTPNIDALAAEGVRFTNFYAAGAVCSPTRCAIQSGQNQARIGITAHIPGHWRPFERVITPQTTMALPLDVVTVGEALQDVGYRTGYVGKWHLGNGREFQPDRQGYEFSVVVGGPHLPGRYRPQTAGARVPKPSQYRTDYEADLCLDFLSVDDDRPFFLMLSPFAVHIPLGAMSDKVAKYQQKADKLNRDLPHPVYAAMVEHCDDMVGRLVTELEKSGRRKNTMIVFTSDNGGLYRRYDYQPEVDDRVTSLAPLRSEKGALYEGGIRVPLIIHHPSAPESGTVCDEPAISYDFFPTFVELAKGQLPESQTIDGASLLPLVMNPRQALGREALHWHYPHYHHDRPASAIRLGDWKLIEFLDDTGDVELYNLKKDLGESNDLSRVHPGRVADLKRRLNLWRRDVVARMPIKNPSYDAEKADQWWSMRTGTPIQSDQRKRFPPTEKDL